jgi:hypothetical protein
MRAQRSGIPDLISREETGPISVPVYVNHRPIHMGNAEALTENLERISAINEIAEDSEQNQILHRQQVDSVAPQPAPRDSTDSV